MPAHDLATLQAIVRAHVERIAFENIDVQLGRAMTTDLGAAFAKLVERRRGGWCYEHNGVLGAALSAIGFDVMRMSAGVLREVRGDEAMGSHLCLLVQGTCACWCNARASPGWSMRASAATLLPPCHCRKDRGGRTRCR